jgi:hypothetical protein
LPKIERRWANADLNKRVDWRFRNHCFARDGDRWHPSARCFDTPLNDSENQSCEEKVGETLSMPDKEVQINFHAPATLRKWPSVNGERVSASLGARPYLIIDGTLDECIRRLMSQPKSQHHLYEIHTAPQSDLVSAILSAEHIVELTRLRDFL